MSETAIEKQQLSLHSRNSQTAAEYPVYVVIGAGPVGVRCAEKLLEYTSDAQIVLIGAEDEPPYNRVRLSQYLSRELSLEELANPVRRQSSDRFVEFHNRRIIDIDRKARIVFDDSGAPQPYTKLILATGSRPTVPDLPGANLDRIIPFRNLRNARDLTELRDRSQTILVAGAGALGLEAAAALKTQKNRVILLARAGLLSGKLSETTEKYLTSALTALQVELKTGVHIEAFFGEESVEHVLFSSGETLNVDAVVLCTGISPEVSLGRDCGLNTGRGIQVSAFMETSDPDIYAIGECAEHDERVYQLVRPGFEQADICSRHICRGTKNATAIPYQGSRTDIELKISHIPCALLGNTEPHGSNDTIAYRYENRFKGLCRELYLQDGKLVGASIVGTWNERTRIDKAITDEERITEKALKQFEQEGFLWQAQEQQGIKQQPDSYLVCQCNGVSKGEICTAIGNGKRSLHDLEMETQAGSVCGSCRPIMAELLDTPAPNLVMRHATSILVISILSLVLIAIAVLLPAPNASTSVQVNWYLKSLWYDNFWKQVSGYTLLVLCLLTASLSLRKRWKKSSLGHLDHWRYFHSIVGCAALVVLIVHTGFRLGENLNLVLMLVFLAATSTGSLVGVFMARNHHWTDLKLREHRKWWSRIHYALLWALPVLIFFHILAVYYF
ncbi:FAD-dependent oxidoreductase [uncultured Microbulbifer sp.]|uniref:FAD-dependent oxidoreductase n=1 Tax=uncultured Microbulbifer sp. TaxID=348147 RepID=UPI002603C32C|nr:FAD-dependent oxidoreductase [uncultured Microbulbifer sp.]